MATEQIETTAEEITTLLKVADFPAQGTKFRYWSCWQS